MKKFWAIFGWIFVGIMLQSQLNLLYGIVTLENLYFHDRAYWVKMDLKPIDNQIKLLTVETTVHHSLGPDYFANVYIPENYKVINKEPYLGAETRPGYKTYQMNMKRKYRDVLSREMFILSPVDKKSDVPETPLIVHFQNMDQLLHEDKTYQLATTKKETSLKGPELAETIYPQQWGM
ncbi:MAG: hypothetical protein G3M70_14525 [Candidatus Nitronauta litoralis]|uniref:Uncharacterized protein n=1 Tax=Candidatus Nitronauta litoralis TaxID=2705533 RepID=A0A7T0BXZ2_9BACT|nr:MAG: hypothetical protein G3M70_14525 [Candidatus Nitronauta litoralis]